MTGHQNSDTAQDPPSPPTFARKAITGLKSQKAPKVRFIVWPMWRFIILPKNVLSFLILTSRDPVHKCENGFLWC